LKSIRQGRIDENNLALARFPLEWKHSSDKKSRGLTELERIPVAKASQLLRNAP
jgi:hypothetical protein